MNNTNSVRLLCFVIMAMLLLAIPSIWGYNYYVFLRWVVFATGLIMAYVYYTAKGANLWSPLFVVIAIVFNPFTPFYLGKELWVLVDIASAIIYAMAGFTYKENKVAKEKGKNN